MNTSISWEEVFSSWESWGSSENVIFESSKILDLVYYGWMTPLEITNPRQTNASFVVGSVTEVHQLKYHLSLCTASEDSTVFYRLYSTFEVSLEVQRGIDSATGKSSQGQLWHLLTCQITTIPLRRFRLAKRQNTCKNRFNASGKTPSPIEGSVAKFANHKDILRILMDICHIQCKWSIIDSKTRKFYFLNQH